MDLYDNDDLIIKDFEDKIMDRLSWSNYLRAIFGRVADTENSFVNKRV
jgi:hypothetical protein